MNELELLRKLGCAAARESVPHVDVTRGTMAEVVERQIGVERPFAWIAGLAAAGAVPVVILAIHVWNDWTDPLLLIFDTFGGFSL